MSIKKPDILSFTIDYNNSYDCNELRGIDLEERPWNLFEKIVEHSGLDKTLLDVGCGTGSKIIPLSPYFKKIVGIDYSDSMLEAANTQIASSGCSNISFQKNDAYQMSFQDKSFDVVTCMLSRWTLPELHRVLADQGILIIEHIGCRDKYELKKYFGLTKEGVARGQYLEYQIDEYLENLKKEIEKYFDIIIFKNAYWKTLYTRLGVTSLLKQTPTIKNYDEYEDHIFLEKAINDLSIDESKNKIVLNQNRMLLVAKKK